MSRPSEPQGEEAAQAQAALQQLTNGYWVTQTIYVAAKLGIADLLQDGPRGIEALARATGTHAPSLSRLMRALASLGVFQETAAGEYAATCTGYLALHSGHVVCLCDA